MRKVGSQQTMQFTYESAHRKPKILTNHLKHTEGSEKGFDDIMADLNLPESSLEWTEKLCLAIDHGLTKIEWHEVYSLMHYMRTKRFSESIESDSGEDERSRYFFGAMKKKDPKIYPTLKTIYVSKYRGELA